MSEWNKTKNILLMLLSVFIALILWLYIVGVENPEADIEKRGLVSFIGQEAMAERGLIITEGQNAAVSLRLRGRRSALIDIEEEKDIKVTLNLSDIKSPGQFNHVYDVSVPSGVTVVDRAPYYINIKAESLVERAIEVRMRLDGNVAEGYTREAAVIDPAQIRVKGPQSVIDNISHALVVIHREEDISASISDFVSSYQLVMTDGNVLESQFVTADVSEVVVDLPVSMYKDIALGVELIEGGGLSASDVVVGLSHETIRVSGDPAILESLNGITVRTVELSKVLDSSTLSAQVVLPNEVRNLSGVTTVNITLTIKPGISKKTIATDRIEIVHRPENFTVSAITEIVSVTIRGPDALVNEIYAHNIRVVVDLQGAELTVGQQSFGANVYLDGYTDVGIVEGDYRVVLDVQTE